jgi:hypothetical protein
MPFSFLISIYISDNLTIWFCLFCALNQRPAWKVSENKFCFHILRLGICSCGDGIAGMLSEKVWRLHFCFYFFVWYFYRLRVSVFECAESSRREGECAVLWFCVRALLPRKIDDDKLLFMLFALVYLFLCFWVFYLMDIAISERRVTWKI